MMMMIPGFLLARQFKDVVILKAIMVIRWIYTIFSVCINQQAIAGESKEGG